MKWIITKAGIFIFTVVTGVIGGLIVHWLTRPTQTRQSHVVDAGRNMRLDFRRVTLLVIAALVIGLFCSMTLAGAGIAMRQLFNENYVERAVWLVAFTVFEILLVIGFRYIGLILLKALKTTKRDVSPVESSGTPGHHDTSVAQPARQHTTLGHLEEATITGLIEQLRHNEWFVRSNAVQALGKYRRLPKRAIGALCEALKDSNPIVAGNAAAALGKIQSRGFTLD